MTTNNSVNTPLAGNTGTGNFVGANTPTLITPVIGAATGTSLAFSPTTGGIVGTTTNDNAGAGKVGEFVSSIIAIASQTPITTNTATDMTSISLTAGDWNVWGNITFSNTVGATVSIGWLSATSATIPDASLLFQLTTGVSTTTSVTPPQRRFSLSGTTTIYISGFETLSGGTAGMSGGIYARRVR